MRTCEVRETRKLIDQGIVQRVSLAVLSITASLNDFDRRECLGTDKRIGFGRHTRLTVRSLPEASGSLVVPGCMDGRDAYLD